MTKDYPQNVRPTTKFVRPGQDPWPQICHMIEELGEIAKAAREGDLFSAGLEAADLQLSAETLIADLQLDGNELRALAIEKNEARGYYQEERSLERRMIDDVIAQIAQETGRRVKAVYIIEQEGMNDETGDSDDADRRNQKLQ